jgi:hypothetical protein
MLKMTTALVLSTTLMTSSIPMPFEKAKGLVVDDDIQIEELKLLEEPHTYRIPEMTRLEKEFEKHRIKKEKKLEEERQTYQQWLNENTRTFVLTYYGSTVNECGNDLGITASGKKVQSGMVASPPCLSFGTQIQIGDNTYVVEDRGHPNFIKQNNDGSIRLDVFIPRLDGESTAQYEKRVNSMGIQRVDGVILRHGRG